MKTRTDKRSRSGAGTPCPRCGKKLRGGKGLKAHLAEAHGEAPSSGATPTPALRADPPHRGEGKELP